MITEALQRARDEGMRELLVDIRGMDGFESPGPAFRRWLVRRWAHVAKKSLVVAVVARAEHICPEKTGLLIAAEEGLDAGIFQVDSEAVSWLDASVRAQTPVS